MDALPLLFFLFGGLYLAETITAQKKAGTPSSPSIPQRTIDLTALRARCVAYSGGDFAAMVADNPNLPATMLTWQHGTADQGGDPYDWQAFRDWLRTLGQPDPGPTLPIIFCGWVG